MSIASVYNAIVQELNKIRQEESRESFERAVDAVYAKLKLLNMLILSTDTAYLCGERFERVADLNSELLLLQRSDE